MFVLFTCQAAVSYINEKEPKKTRKNEVIMMDALSVLDVQNLFFSQMRRQTLGIQEARLRLRFLNLDQIKRGDYHE